MPFVVDASVALTWCLLDEQSDYSERVLLRLSQDVARVPPLWGLELANGLLVALRRGRLNEADLALVRGLISDLAISPAELSFDDARVRVLDLARNQRLTAYDAAYLDLAMREGLPLATQDDDLITAARRVGVTLLA